MIDVHASVTGFFRVVLGCAPLLAHGLNGFCSVLNVYGRYTLGCCKQARHVLHAVRANKGWLDFEGRTTRTET
jgi:hypothetical protein